jgi:hypothetical protein
VSLPGLVQVREPTGERIAQAKKQLAGMRAKASRLAAAIRERETNLARLEPCANRATSPARPDARPTY